MISLAVAFAAGVFVGGTYKPVYAYVARAVEVVRGWFQS